MLYTTADPLITKTTLTRDLQSLGVQPGDNIVVHSSIRAIRGTGYIAGGAQAIIEALQETITPSGTLIMPTHSGDMSDPGEWQNPPVPPEWWAVIRSERPLFDPHKTPTYKVGFLPELFRTYPSVTRSNHPLTSFAAWGQDATFITADHALADEFGDDSPLGKNILLNGKVLLLGVDHGNNTTLHCAEQRAHWPGKPLQVATVPPIIDSSDFAQLGVDFERDHADLVQVGTVGAGIAQLTFAQPLVTYAHSWFEKHRPASLETPQET